MARARATEPPVGRPEPGDLPGAVLESAEIAQQRAEGGRAEGDQVLAGHPVAVVAGILEEITGITGDFALRPAYHHGPLVGALASMGQYVGLPAGPVGGLDRAVVGGGEARKAADDPVQVGAGHLRHVGPGGGDIGHGGAKTGVKPGVLVAELAVQLRIGGIEGAHGHAGVAFPGQELAHQGPGEALAPVLRQHGHGADAGARDLFAAQPLAEGDGVGDGHYPLAGVGAQPAAVVEGDLVRSGLHVEGQRPYGGNGSPVGVGRRADFDHGGESLSIGRGGREGSRGLGWRDLV